MSLLSTLEQRTASAVERSTAAHEQFRIAPIPGLAQRSDPDEETPLRALRLTLSDDSHKRTPASAETGRSLNQKTRCPACPDELFRFP